MPQKSTIHTQLSDEDKAALNKLIVSGKLTLDALLEWLNEKDYDIKRSALHLHVTKQKKVAAKLRESREMTEALVREMGPSISEGHHGRVLVEIMRSMVFDFQMKLIETDGGKNLEPGDFFFLAKALKEMAQAARLDQDFETKIRERVAKEERKKAAGVAGKAAKKAGISEKARKEIEETILRLNR